MVGLGLNLGLATAPKTGTSGSTSGPAYRDENPTQQSTVRRQSILDKEL